MRDDGYDEAKVSAARTAIASALAAARKPCLTSSFQAECVVLTHLVRAERPDVPVLFLDTFHHFAETLAYRDQIAAAWRLRLVNLRAAEPQPGLWQAETTEACCARHKVQPLFAELARHDVWLAGLRREQSPSRAQLQELEPFRLPGGTVIRRVSPLAAWTTRDVWTYAQRHAIPLLPLYERGYASIGCEPCTSVPDDPANPRSGRWQGRKLECGIHIQAPATSGGRKHEDTKSRRPEEDTRGRWCSD
jgi:phosphoadenosine phosphosulfate reductase